MELCVYEKTSGRNSRRDRTFDKLNPSITANSIKTTVKLVRKSYASYILITYSTSSEIDLQKARFSLSLFKYRETCIGDAQKHAKSFLIHDTFATC